MSCKLAVLNTDVDAHNGHHFAHVQIVEDCGDGVTKKGAVESHGIDAMALDSRHDGDIDKWLAHVAQRMMLRYHQQCKSKTALLGLKGKQIPIPDPPVS